MGYTAGKVGFQSHSTTSEDAARATAKSGAVHGQANMIAKYLEQVGIYGATADELRTHLRGHGYPNIQSGTVAARLAALEARNVAVKTTSTRPTQSQRQAVVYLRGMGHLDSPLLPTRPAITTLRRDLENILAALERNPNGVTILHGGQFHAKLRAVLGGV